MPDTIKFNIPHIQYVSTRGNIQVNLKKISRSLDHKMTATELEIFLSMHLATEEISFAT